jgi:hypothetical protein
LSADAFDESQQLAPFNKSHTQSFVQLQYDEHIMRALQQQREEISRLDLQLWELHQNQITREMHHGLTKLNYKKIKTNTVGKTRQ